MKITICTAGRFHVADLARELITLGHEVTFHSIVPPQRLEAFGIPRKNQRCHLAAVAPWVALQRLRHMPAAWKSATDLRMLRILDARYARITEPGDVFIGMSGLCSESLRAAKARGAMVHLERGSRHILSQKRILDAIAPDRRSTVPDWAVKRELAGYELADRIVVGSRHAEQSFLDEGFPQDRIFRNPYGVNLAGFAPTAHSNDPFDVIMVGRWSRRKGCGLLAKIVLDDLGLTLLHVGPVEDLALPQHPRFFHQDPVPQARLPEFYARARIFAMPTREDGFGMVYTQALACGLPIIGSTRSGSPDLAELIGLGPPIIQSVEPDDALALASAIQTAFAYAKQQPASQARNLMGAKAEELSWAAYARRYHDFLSNLQ